MASFYLRFRGQISGPYAGDEVRRMLDRELVTAAHELSTDRVTWSSARGTPLIDRADDDAPELSVEHPGDSGHGVSFLDQLLGTPSGRAIPITARWGFPRGLPMVVGLSCGSLLVYSSFIPSGCQDGTSLFWWSGPSGSATAGVTSLLIGLLCAGVSVVGEPVWRGTTMIILAAIGLLGLLALGMDGLALAAAATVQGVAAAGAAVTIAYGIHRTTQRLPSAATAAIIFGAGAAIVLIISAWRFAGTSSAPEARHAVLTGVRLVVTSAAWSALMSIGIMEHAATRRPRHRWGLAPHE